MRKITLNADPEIIDLAKRLAEERGASVSELFSQFIQSMAKPRRPTSTARSTRKATGLVKIPANKTERQLVEEAVAERFLR